MDVNTLLEEFNKFVSSNHRRTEHDNFMLRKVNEFLENLVKFESSLDSGVEKLNTAIKDIPEEVVVTDRRVLFEIEYYTRRWLLIILGSMGFFITAAYFLGERKSQTIMMREINSLNTQLRKSEEHSNYHRQFSKKTEANWQKLQDEE